jgi:hypothetical protein
MCVIILASKKSGHISKNMIKKAERANDHGMGIAWVNQDNKVEWAKGLNSKSLIKLMRKRKIKFPYIIHARIASVGDICNELCHPFEISLNPSLDLTGTTDQGVLFHNGTWSDYNKFLLMTICSNNLKMYDGKNSDSRSLAFLVKAHGTSILKTLPEQKIAILTPKGIQYFGDFPKVNKHICSNTWFNSSIINDDSYTDEYDTQFYNRFNNPYANFEDQESYCNYCDRLVPHDLFTYSDDMCDYCTKRNNLEWDNNYNTDSIIAKRYIDDNSKGAIKKWKL